MADYPTSWEADVVLADGGTAHLRPIRPDDAEGLLAFHARLSPDTVYRRFFGPHPRLSTGEVTRFTTVDHVDRVALVATVAGDLVAVARYDRIDPESAEVAFVVEDAHQGRGLGTVMLEHLAAAAQERGLQRFVADVLPVNRQMIGVFLTAGFEARRSYEEGVVRLEFPIAPTERSLAVMAEREHRAEARSIERLLAPRSVVVVGVEDDPHSPGRVVLANLLAAGPSGPVHVVHPVLDEVAGVRAYRRVADVPAPVDLAVVAGPTEGMVDVVEQCAGRQVRGVVVLSGGFAEAGEEGRARQQRLVATAREHGMRVVGPNALGIINTDPQVSLNASLAPVLPQRGRAGFFCQSGALGAAILQTVARRGIGLSTFVSAGNRADVSGNDLLQYWEDDPATDVVLLYLEVLGNPRKFGRVARRVARTKPVVAVKTGRSLAGPPPGQSATGVALPEHAVEALFAQAGVVRVDTLRQLLDVATLLGTQPLPEGRRVGVVGNSSAVAVLVADACLGHGLEVVRSVDLGPGAGPAAARAALDDLLRSGDVDAVVTTFAPALTGPAQSLVSVVGEAARSAPKPIVSTSEVMEDVPAAVLALARAVAYAEWRRRPAGALPVLADVDQAAARDVVTPAVAAHPSGVALRDAEVARLLRAYGVTVSADAAVGGGVAVEVTVNEDPSFGAIVSFGLGGLATDLLGDRAYRAVPLTDVDAHELVRAAKASPLLFGYGGGRAVDVAALEDLLLRVGRLADDLPEVVGLTLDPVFATPAGVAVRRASARVALPASRPDLVRRRMG